MVREAVEKEAPPQIHSIGWAVAGQKQTHSDSGIWIKQETFPKLLINLPWIS